MPPVTFRTLGGVPAYWADIRIPFTGTLTFGIGLRDATARTAGIAHLIEHLVMKRVGRPVVAHNATTADETISFYAQGAPDQVVDFLDRVMQAIGTLHEITDADVVEQRRIIAAELGADDERPGRGALVNRFGAKSIGLLDIGSPGHRSITRDDALAFSDRWLHAGNATLAFTGEIPPGLTVALPPARPMAPRVPATLLPHRITGWIADGSAPLTITMMLGPADRAELAVATSTIAEALESELRTAQQSIYSVSGFVAPISDGSRFVAYGLDPRPEDAVETGAAAMRVLRELAERGPSAEQLQREREAWSLSEDDPAWQAEMLDSIATAVVRGRRRPEDVSVSDVSSVQPSAVREVIARGMESVYVTLGIDLDEDDPEVNEALGLPFSADATAHLATLDKKALFRHLMRSGVEVFNARMFRGMKGQQVAVDEDRVTLIVPETRLAEVRFDDITLASYSVEGRVWVLFVGAGHGLVLDLDDWRGGDKLHALLNARLPADARFDVDVPAQPA